MDVLLGIIETKFCQFIMRHVGFTVEDLIPLLPNETGEVLVVVFALGVFPDDLQAQICYLCVMHFDIVARVISMMNSLYELMCCKWCGTHTFKKLLSSI